MAVVDKNLETKLQELDFGIQFYDDYMNDVNPSEATSIYVSNWKDYFMANFKLPKKKVVDLEWVMNKVNATQNKDKAFTNFSNTFKKLLEAKGYKNSMNVYPTSYGIGIFVLFNYRDSNQKMKSDINEILESYGIEYRNEVSDASWVFRYVISKKKENIEKLNSF